MRVSSKKATSNHLSKFAMQHEQIRFAGAHAMVGADLSDEEVDSICAGYVQNAAKVRFLRGMGLTVRIKPNGRPLVNRKHYDATLGGVAQANPVTGNGPVWGVH